MHQLHFAEAALPASPQARSIVQISPAAVQSLIAMGYSQQSAETALMQVGGRDVQAAIEQLTG